MAKDPFPDAASFHKSFLSAHEMAPKAGKLAPLGLQSLPSIALPGILALQRRPGLGLTPEAPNWNH